MDANKFLGVIDLKTRCFLVSNEIHEIDIQLANLKRKLKPLLEHKEELESYRYDLLDIHETAWWKIQDKKEKNK